MTPEEAEGRDNGADYHGRNHNNDARDKIPDLQRAHTVSLLGVLDVSLTANVNNWNPDGGQTNNVWRITGNGNYNITGIVGGSRDRLQALVNADTADTYTLKHEVTSRAENQLSLPGGLDIALTPGVGIVLRYDAKASRWRPLPGVWNHAHAASGGGGLVSHAVLTNLVAPADDHTQYVLRSILTTNGDMFIRSGGVISRLGIGGATTILGVTGGLPAWQAQTYIDHGSISGLSDDDHTQYILHSLLTTRGDLLVRGSAINARLPIGTSGQVLLSNGTDPIWSAVSSGAGFDEAVDDRVALLLQNGGGLTWTYNDAANTLTPAIDHGGLGGLGDDDHTQYVLKSILTTTGDIFYASAASTPARLAIGTAGYILTVSGGLPAWAAPSAATAHAILSATHTDSVAAAVTRGALVVGNSTPAWNRLALGAAGTVFRSDGSDAVWSSNLPLLGWFSAIGSSANPTNTGAGEVTVAKLFLDNDSNFFLDTVASKPQFAVDTGDYVQYDRTNNKWEWGFGGSVTNYMTQSDFSVATGYMIGGAAASGAFLRGDGTRFISGSIAVGDVPAHNLLSATHGDTLAASVVDGDIVIGNVTPKWSRLAISIPAANVRNVLGVDNGELRPSWKAALDATVPTTIAESAAAAAGTSLVFSHRDHTHGAPATWAATAHNVLSATHGDALAASVVDGDVMIGNVTPKWSRLAITVPAANILNVLGVVNGELRPSWKAVHDGTAPTTSAVGDAAAAGTSLLSAHRDHAHGREAFATNAIVLGSAAAAGVATTLMRRDDTIAAFDTTNPRALALGDAAVIGTAAFAARRDHGHALTGTFPNVTMANTDDTAWTPGFTGFSVNPTVTLATYQKFGGMVAVTFIQNALGTSNATTFTITGLPFAPANAMSLSFIAAGGANNSANIGAVTMNLSGTVLTCAILATDVNGAGNTWTNAGTKGVYGFTIVYPYV